MKTKTSHLLKLAPLMVLMFFSVVGMTQVNMVVKEGGFLFLEGKDSICFYQKSPRDKAGKFSRAHYIHPLYGMDNSRLTEDFPADHLHHRGVFWAWHQVLINNQPVSDGWELKYFHQEVVDVEFMQQDGMGYLNTTVNWTSPLWKEGAEAYLQENTTIRMHTKTGNHRQIDFEIKLTALADGLSIGGSDDEKGYSGFSVRLKLPADVSFSGVNGPVEPVNTAVEAGNFMKLNGSFLNKGKKGGVVIKSDPQNPAPSTHWIIRKSASMQNAAYPGRQPVSIPRDQPLVLKYSLVVFEGDLKM